MSEDVKAVVAEQTEELAPNGEGEAVDWEAKYHEAIKHSREWERRSKENKDAADELERLRTERMSESEKLQARAEKAEAELSRISAENERTQAAREVSAVSDVPFELLMFCSDREHMEQFVELYKQNSHVSSAPKMQKSRVVRDTSTPTSNRDVFAEMAANLF